MEIVHYYLLIVHFIYTCTLLTKPRNITFLIAISHIHIPAALQAQKTGTKLNKNSALHKLMVEPPGISGIKSVVDAIYQNLTQMSKSM